MTPIVAPLTEKQLEYIADILSNDEISTDEELREIMLELEILDPFIDQALALRDSFLRGIYILELNENNQLVKRLPITYKARATH